MTFMFFAKGTVASAFEHSLQLFEFLRVDKMFRRFVHRRSLFVSTHFKYVLNMFDLFRINNTCVIYMTFFTISPFLCRLLVLLLQTKLPTLNGNG